MEKKPRLRRKIDQFVLMFMCRCKLFLRGLRSGGLGQERVARKKIYVHIGTHKTGTTSIQDFMRRHTRLLEKCGILVPRSGTHKWRKGHHNIAWDIRSDPLLEPGCGGVDDLICELRAADESVALISSEDFEYLVQYPNELRQFHARLLGAGYEPIYLIFFRNKTDYMKSLRLELKKQAIDEPLDWFESEIREHRRILVNGDWYYDFDYDRFLNNWKAAVGESVLAFDYDRACASPGLLPFFFETVGASKEVIAASGSSPRLNISKTGRA
ncbi:MAG: hypothetical protein E7774_03690 [Bradyrhizobium sp.]|nr:MAG: hypothetical protein E7774_03690 [Bradyrhizobium sp.]